MASRTLKSAVGIAFSFTALIVLIVFLWAEKIVSSVMARLMLVALLGLYVGFGVLIAIYRFVNKLE